MTTIDCVYCNTLRQALYEKEDLGEKMELWTLHLTQDHTPQQLAECIVGEYHWTNVSGKRPIHLLEEFPSWASIKKKVLTS